MSFEEAYTLIYGQSEVPSPIEIDLKAAEDAFISAILNQEDRLIM